MPKIRANVWVTCLGYDASDCNLLDIATRSNKK